MLPSNADISHVDKDRTVHDPVCDSLRMDPAAELRRQPFFLDWVQKVIGTRLIISLNYVNLLFTTKQMFDKVF